MRNATVAAAVAICLGVALGSAPLALAQESPPEINNPATDHHGLPNNNPSRGGSSANPNGVGKNGGGGIHGIGNVPGQLGINPNDDGVPGFANQLDTVHGGLGGGHQPGRHRH
jgi:hypothetical protein